jgi:hypothetical protein
MSVLRIRVILWVKKLRVFLTGNATGHVYLR